jgi:hypothetical protein
MARCTAEELSRNNLAGSLYLGKEVPTQKPENTACVEVGGGWMRQNFSQEGIVTCTPSRPYSVENLDNWESGHLWG